MTRQPLLDIAAAAYHTRHRHGSEWVLPLPSNQLLAGMKERIECYKFTENADGTVLFQVQPLYILNNIGQRLTHLMEEYRFFHVGLEASDESIGNHRKTVELRFPNATSRSLADARKSAHALLNRNFIVNLIEIANEELVEILLMLVAMRHADSNIPYKHYLETNRKERDRLTGAHLPRLVELVEAEVGPCSLRECILSVNKVRRAFVHCGGRVDRERLTLALHGLSLFLDNSLDALSNPATSPGISKETMTFKDHEVPWAEGQEIELDDRLCINMVLSVMSFFAQVINVNTMARYPWANTEKRGPANQAL